MKFPTTLLVTLLLGAVAASGSPVEKVVTLLQDLKARVEADGDAEQLIYDKFACWCETITKKKAYAINDAKAELHETGQEILKHKGTVSTRSSEILQLTADIRTNLKAQETATAIRQKENAEYMAESAEMKQAIAALEKATIVLRDHSASSLLQAESATVARLASSIGNAVSAVPEKAMSKIPLSKLELLRTYADQLAKAKKGKVSYQPQSTTISGILQDMYDTFVEDLEKSTGTEGRDNKGYENFIASKQDEVNTHEKSLKKKEKEKAEAEMMLAEETQHYDDTESQMHADVEFFDTTKDSCDNKNTEWGTRKSMRAEELAGITKALEILTGDDARDLFGKSIKAGIGTGTFLQVASSETAEAPVAKMNAFEALKKGATKSHSLRLARLAAQVQTTADREFGAVITAIDNIIGDLRAEEAADISKRDQCKDQYRDIESKIKHEEWEIQKNNAEVDKLENIISQMTAERTKTIEEIHDVQGEIVDMNTTRSDENAAFLQAKSDDQDAIVLLQQAQTALGSFYAKHSDTDLGVSLVPVPAPGAAFLQAGAPAPRDYIGEVSEHAPDATFSDQGHRGGEAKGIVQLLQMIIEDLQEEISTGIRLEGIAQLDHEKAFWAAYNLQSELQRKQVNLKRSISEREGDETTEEAKRGLNTKEKNDEITWKNQIKGDCDWIIGSFTERKEARAAEMDGLVKAKEFLAGAAVPKAETGFLDTKTHHFDDTKFEKINFNGLGSATRRLRRAPSLRAA